MQAMTSLTVVVDDRLCFGDVGENLEQFGWVGIGQPCGGWSHVRRRDRPGPSYHAAAGERFIACCDGGPISMLQAAYILRDWAGVKSVIAAPMAQVSSRGVMMPRRRRTRAADRAKRINEERALNDTHVAERNRPPPF
jgi:hypothetical protein